MSLMTNEQKAEMASDTWERIADERLVEIARLKAEVARLKGLLQRASDESEGAVSSHCCNNCPWCEGENLPHGGRFRHADECPAFTPDGKVK